MDISNWITISAIIIGPIAAVQIEKLLERIRDSRNRKMSIFKTLMATRGTPLSYSHVEALNRIELEFSKGKKYEGVISTWKEYFDNLGQRASDEDLTSWNIKNEELLANLLFEMGSSLGLKFDKVSIKRNVYSPIGHLNIEREQQALRKGLIEVLDGDRDIPMSFVQDEDSLKRAAELHDLMTKYYQQQIDQAKK